MESYDDILNDTLIGFAVTPYLATTKRKAITRSKYFLFDIGVVNSLTNRGYVEYRSELFGRAFKHFIALELRALKEEGLIEKYGVVSLDMNDRVTHDGIHIWSWRSFLAKLWARELL